MLVELTLSLAEGMSMPPNHPSFDEEHLSYGMEDPEVQFRRFSPSNYQGTNINAPSHPIKDNATIDQLGPDVFAGPTTVQDLREYSGKAITAEVHKAVSPDLHPERRIILATGDVDLLLFLVNFQ